MTQFRNVYLDISGICNAKCPYCLSGRYKKSSGKFIAVEIFDQILEQLVGRKLVDKQSVLGLYNWGEPFLHPQLGDLVTKINKFELPYIFSTNASIIPSIDRSFISGLKMIIFSMPGFSQSSYDRIHGFRFQSILKNIKTIVDNANSVGFKGIFSIHYHVYQFNMNEIALCEAFSKRLGINLELHYAILNHWDHLWAYVDNDISYSMLKEISQDLFCFDLRNLTPDKMGTYRCPQYDLLAIDEFANVLLCCQVPKDTKYVAGNILHDDIQEIQRKRMHNDTCTRCIERGMARYLNTALEFALLGRKYQNIQYLGKRIYRKISKMLLPN